LREHFSARVVERAPKPLTERAYGQFAAGRLRASEGRSLEISHQAITRTPGGQHAWDMFRDVLETFRNERK